MQLIKTEYVPLKGCIDFLSWLWFTRDYPFGAMYGDDRYHWWKYCGSDDRLLIRRRFGFTREHRYSRQEDCGFLHMALFAVAVAAASLLVSEITVILMLFL